MLERIRASLPALPPAEQRVARLVLADPRGFAGAPVGELAERAHVSKPTVVRFCRSVGYGGLADFKLKLAGSVNEGLPLGHHAIDEHDTAADLVVKVVDNAVSALLRYRNQASDHAFERAIAALARACREGRRVEFWGVGQSGIVAQDAQHRFFRLGAAAATASDAHVQVMRATLLQPGDVAVVFSHTGRSTEPIDATEIARRKGATTVLVTATGSPLALSGGGSQQVLIAVDPPEDADRHGPTVSRLLQLAVVDILATGTALRVGREWRPLQQEMKRNLRARRYAPAAP